MARENGPEAAAEGMAGAIYVLTNPCMPGLVKLGYANNVKERVKQLNRSSAAPEPFDIYATYQVPHRLSDRTLHKLICQLKPELRLKNREFFRLSAEDAYTILKCIAEISGTEGRLTGPDQSPRPTPVPPPVPNPGPRPPSPNGPFRFSLCNISKGEEVEFIYDRSIKATVVDDRHVEYGGKRWKLSPLACELHGGRNKAYQGPNYFLYKGEKLLDLKRRLENDEKRPSPPDAPDGSLFLNARGARATGRKTLDGFVVCRGSVICQSFTPSCPASVRKARAQYADKIDEDGKLTEDLTFHSPSAASSFVLGENSSGPRVWKNSSGVSLRDIDRRLENDEKRPSPPDAPDGSLFLNARGARATGRKTPDGFVVCRGSVIRQSFTPSCQARVRKARAQYADKIDEDGKLTEDLTFHSPSAASSFVLGTSSSGPRDWKNSSGVSLRDIDK